MNRIARRVNQPRGHEDQQVAFVSHGGLGAEQAPDHRNVAEERNFIINLRELLRDKTAQNDRLTVPNYDAGDQVAGGKQRLLDVVGSRDGAQVDGVPIVNESKEIRDLGDEGQADRVTVGSHERSDIEDHADRSSCESSRSRWNYRRRRDGTGDSRAWLDSGGAERCGINELLRDADLCLRAADRSNLWRREDVGALLLGECLDNDLELWVGQDAANGPDLVRARGGGAETSAGQQGVNRISLDSGGVSQTRRNIEGLIRGRTASGRKGSSPVAAGSIETAKLFGPHLPVETKLIEIVLGNFHKLGLDFNLRRDGIERRQDALEILKVLNGVVDDEHTGAGVVKDTGIRGEQHTGRDEHFPDRIR
jgi:hypothetical protein